MSARCPACEGAALVHNHSVDQSARIATLEAALRDIILIVNGGFHAENIVAACRRALEGETL